MRKDLQNAFSIAIALPVLAAAAAPPPVAGAEVKIFRSETREAVLEGKLEALSVDPLGVIELAPRVERLKALEEPFVFCADGHPDGWVVGTGNSGKVLLLDGSGEVSELHAAGEPEIFAVLADGDGTVYAGSSPKGKVYRIAGGDAEVVFEPGESYVWDLALDKKRRLLVATGLRGRLYRLPQKGGDAEVLFESRDSHVRSIAVLADGSVLAGTAGQGLIVRIAPDGEVSTLHDAVHPEVLAFAATPAGTVYAALMASEASQVDLSGQRPAAAVSGKEGGEGGGQAKVVVVAQGEGTIGSRSAGFSGPRSVILEISPDRKVEQQVLDFQDETVHSLLWREGELWIGTGQEGRLYRWVGRKLRQERVLEEQQLAALAAGGAGLAVVTANAAAIYRLEVEREAAGIYTSKVFDAGQVARFGSFLWEGSLPQSAGVEVAFRSGMSSQPDDTWSAWSCAGCADAVECRDGDAACRGTGLRGRRQEVPLAELAHGRYVQWRAKLEGGGEKTPRLAAAELSYRQENLRPKVDKLEVLDPGKILVPQSFNPTSQTFEPWSPDKQGIFTTLRNAPKKNGSSLKTLWKRGYRTLRWTVKDANEDRLSYRLEFRLDGDSSNGDSSKGDSSKGTKGERWLTAVEEIEKDYYSFDATVLPDGVYRFRLTASDRPAHSAAEALSEEELSEPVVIDHVPPVLESVERRDGVIEVTVRDALSPMRDAVVSIDAGEWQAAAAADGLLDGRREVIRVEAPKDAGMILLRLTDAHFNVVTFDLVNRP